MDPTLKELNTIEVVLKTNLPDDYSIENPTYDLSKKLDTIQLNKLIKKLISVNESKDFIFFIDNKLLDTTIEQFLNNNPELLKLSEKSVEIYYSLRIDEPKLANTIKEDEWIRKISVRKGYANKLDYYCVGLFNSEISLYSPGNEKVLTIDEVKDKDSLCELLHDVLFFKSENENILIKCSRNEDQNAKVYSVDLTKMTATQTYSLPKHNDEYINCLSLNPVSFSFFCAGGSDGKISIIKLPESTVEKKTVKKRKIEYQNLEPQSVLEGCHNEVKNVLWLNNQQMLSSGDDFVVKLWNISTKTNYSSYSMSYKLCTALTNIISTETFLTGQEDGRIKLWDIRQNKPTISFVGHSYSAADIAVLPESVNNFVSVGYDGNVKLWDTRSSKKSLYDIKSDSEKNYSVAFNTRDYILTGGDNSTVNVYNLP
jgi:ribosome biogenesis protein YTM1